MASSMVAITARARRTWPNFRRPDSYLTRHGNATQMIGDMEALLIKAMGLTNIAQMNFHDAVEWTQIKLDEVNQCLQKLQ
jgi:hypothetical protein